MICETIGGLRVILLDPGADPLPALKAGRFANRGPYLGFDSLVTSTPLRLAVLRVLRVGLDGLERIQDRVILYLRSRARR